jgi:hypothetical protein
MKTRALVSMLILVSIVLVIAGSCATKKKTVSTKDAMKIRSGRWINEAFLSEQLTVFHVNGEYEIFDTPQQQKPVVTGISIMYESWRDSDGALWYRARYQDSTGQEGYVLGKMNDDDEILEFLFTFNNIEIVDWDRNKGAYNYLGPLYRE